MHVLVCMYVLKVKVVWHVSPIISFWLSKIFRFVVAQTLRRILYGGVSPFFVVLVHPKQDK